MFYSGIDQHKRDCVITTYDADGHRVKQQRVPNDRPRLRACFAQFAGPHQAVVESTGFWYWLADLLDDLGVELTLAHATRLEAIATAKVKTDRLDSDLLAQLLRAGRIPAAHRIARADRGPRDLLRLRLRLVEKRVSGPQQSRTRPRDVPRHALEAALQPHLIPHPDVQRLLWIPGIGGSRPRLGPFA